MRDANFKRTANHSERGVYFVLTTAFIVALIFMTMLVLGLGLEATNNQRLTNAANLASLAAIQKFVEDDGAIADNGSAVPLSNRYRVKADRALARANYILSQNTLPGFARAFGELGHYGATPAGEAGSMEFGNWFASNPNGALGFNDPCAGEYPCFRRNSNGPPVDGQTYTANAVRISLKSQSNNPLASAGFGKFIGYEGAVFAEPGVASITPRCTAYLMDVSRSSVSETHPTAGESLVNALDASEACTPGTNACRVVGPQYPALFAYRYSNIGPVNAAGVPLTWNCNRPADFSDPTKFYERSYWCTMSQLRPDPAIDTGFSPQKHYRSDYRLMGAAPLAGEPEQRLYLDSYYNPTQGYTGPQPLTRQFLAVNAGLRLVAQQASAADRAMVYFFAKSKIFQLPDPATQGQTLTQDLNFLAQITDVMNSGKINWAKTQVSQETHPNFTDFGAFPLVSSSHSYTNFSGAIDEVVDSLNSQCPANSLKSIVLGSDGVPSCNRNAIGQSPSHVCYDQYSQDEVRDYRRAEAELLSASGNDVTGRPTILKRLLENQISLTMLHDASYVQPNIKNIYKDGHYVSYEEAAAMGFGGILTYPEYTSLNFFDWTSSVPAYIDPNPSDIRQVAYNNLGKPGVFFRRAVGVWGEIALKSGGVYCWLSDPCASGDYEDADNDPTTPPTLKPSSRTGVATQTCSLERENRIEQAARCIQKTVAGNPYTLAEG